MKYAHKHGIVTLSTKINSFSVYSFDQELFSGVTARTVRPLVTGKDKNDKVGQNNPFLAGVYVLAVTI